MRGPGSYIVTEGFALAHFGPILCVLSRAASLTQPRPRYLVASAKVFPSGRQRPAKKASWARQDERQFGLAVLRIAGFYGARHGRLLGGASL